jgi:hypothetical protein
VPGEQEFDDPHPLVVGLGGLTDAGVVVDDLDRRARYQGTLCIQNAAGDRRPHFLGLEHSQRQDEYRHK